MLKKKEIQILFSIQNNTIVSIFPLRSVNMIVIYIFILNLPFQLNVSINFFPINDDQGEKNMYKSSSVSFLRDYNARYHRHVHV